MQKLMQIIKDYQLKLDAKAAVAPYSDGLGFELELQPC